MGDECYLGIMRLSQVGYLQVDSRRALMNKEVINLLSGFIFVALLFWVLVWYLL